MEQNNFEKKVHQKMDELRIQPTDQVWANVEKRIAKKNGKKIKVRLRIISPKHLRRLK